MKRTLLLLFAAALGLSGQAVQNSQTPFATVTFSATPTFNVATAGPAFKITLTGNVTSSTLSNAAIGQVLTFMIVEDGTGGRTFVWPTGFSGACPISTNASVSTLQSFLWDGSTANPIAACPAGGPGTSVTSATPVTATANVTTDQQLMELTLTAGYFNSLRQPFLFNGAGVYTTPAAQTPTLTFKVKLCTVSGCGSGTVVTLASIVTTPTLASSTNNNWNINLVAYTATTGATGNLEIHGPLSVDLGALTTTADSIFNDVNTAVSSNIDLTAALFVDFTVATSTGNASNAITQRQGGVMPFAATAAPVTSVFTQTGAVGNLTGDCTTTNTTAVTCTKINGTAFSGTTGDVVDFGAANTPADSGFLATNVVRKDAANTAAAAMTLDMSGATGATAFKVPVIAGATAGGDGVLDYDSTAKLMHQRTNAADSISMATLATDTTTTHVPFATATPGIYTSRAIATADLPAALANQTSVNGVTIPAAVGNATATQTIANGTASLGTSAISSGACATVVTVAGTGIATTDDIIADFNADPTAVTGYAPTSNGMLAIIKYPTSGNVNFKVCNNTSASVTPGAITLNWRVVR